jgi:phosphosulfolactate synthase
MCFVQDCGKGLLGLSDARAFDGVITTPLAGRLAKPRRNGHTMIIDKGLGLSQTGDLLELASEYIDFIKLTFGTPALYPTALLRAKIALIQSYGIDTYPGGTFFEIAMTQGALEGYLQQAKSLGFTYIEVSDGTIELDPADRRAAIGIAREFGFRVITEVGKKESGVHLDPAEALELIRSDLETGADKVIVEGRESGKGAGIYDADGRARTDDLEAIVAGLHDPGLLMWEAPLKAQQEALIARFGTNVNLGNIPPEEALAVEALRRGLRGDTLRLALHDAYATPGRNVR